MCGDKTSTARLACDRCRGSICVAAKMTDGRNCLGAVSAFAAVHISNEDTTILIKRHVKKIQQVATDVCAAFCPDTATLHRRVRSCIGGRPGCASVKGIRHIQVPDSVKVRLQCISGC